MCAKVFKEKVTEDVEVTVTYRKTQVVPGAWGEITPDDGGDYTIKEVPEDEVPLGLLEGEHKDCIMHFLLTILIFATQLIYNKKKKKYEEEIFEMKKKLGLPMDEKEETK